MIRPSSLPPLDKCPRYVSLGGEHAEGGIRRHKALAAMLAAHTAPDKTAAPLVEAADKALEVLCDEDREAVQWAFDYVLLHAPLMDHPLTIEAKASWVRPDFSTAEGTPDYHCGPVLFDLKTRVRDYKAQMADYSLALMESGRF